MPADLFITLGTDGDELDTLASNEVKCLVDVGDLVEPHFAAVGLGESLARYDLEEKHQLEAVAEVLLDVLDLSSRFPQVGVHPSSKRLREMKKIIKNIGTKGNTFTD